MVRRLLNLTMETFGRYDNPSVYKVMLFFFSLFCLLILDSYYSLACQIREIFGYNRNVAKHILRKQNNDLIFREISGNTHEHQLWFLYVIWIPFPVCRVRHLRQRISFNFIYIYEEMNPITQYLSNPLFYSRIAVKY